MENPCGECDEKLNESVGGQMEKVAGEICFDFWAPGGVSGVSLKLMGKRLNEKFQVVCEMRELKNNFRVFCFIFKKLLIRDGQLRKKSFLSACYLPLEFKFTKKKNTCSKIFLLQKFTFYKCCPPPDFKNFLTFIKNFQPLPPKSSPPPTFK